MAGSFRNLLVFASALPGEEVALPLESPEGGQVCAVTALMHNLHLAQTQGSAQVGWSRHMLGVTARDMGMSMGVFVCMNPKIMLGGAVLWGAFCCVLPVLDSHV